MLVSFAGDNKQTSMPHMCWANEEKRHYTQRDNQVAM